MVTLHGPERCGYAVQDAGWGNDEREGVLQQPYYARLWNCAYPYLQTRMNELHTRIALACAVKLLETEGGDPEVVLAGIILHDIGWSAVPESLQADAFGLEVRRPDLQKLHEDEGARMARDILMDVGCVPETIDEIVHIIARHDTDPVAVSLNDAVVKDADKLWRFTRDGFGTDVKRFHRRPEDLLADFEERIDEWFFTKTAARKAREEVSNRRDELARK